MAKTKPLLELSTLAPEAVYITIDGVEYPLRRVGDMGVREQAQFVRMGQRIQELYGSSVKQDLRDLQQELTAALVEDPDGRLQSTIDMQEQVKDLSQNLNNFNISDEDAMEIEKTINGFVGLIVDAPPEVLDKLHMYQQQQIMQVFTQASGIKTPEAIQNQ